MVCISQSTRCLLLYHHHELKKPARCHFLNASTTVKMRIMHLPINCSFPGVIVNSVEGLINKQNMDPWTLSCAAIMCRLLIFLNPTMSCSKLRHLLVQLLVSGTCCHHKTGTRLWCQHIWPHSWWSTCLATVNSTRTYSLGVIM